MRVKLRECGCNYKSIEKTAELTNSFKLVRNIAICGECGFKDEPMTDKCPKCKSPYIV